MSQLVFIDRKRVVTDSLTVAEVFGKEHKNVKRDILNQVEKIALTDEVDFIGLNFERIDYVDGKGRKQEKILLTEDAFTLIAMSYVTPEAMKFKIKFIQEFKAMREELQKPKVLTDHQQRIELLKLSLEHEEKFVEYDGRLSKLEDNVRIDSFEQDALQKQIKKRVYKVFETANPNGLDLKKLFPCIHRNFRDAFGVPTYRDLRKLDYEEAVSWVSTWRPLI
ncbi:Rha family transcriptional regulator [Niallia sp. FSL R7-0271]|uniref:Rha family transcriptional regulator n=1 Tax=Niallia sp. FSL R7-0271 TaxID=2921678 RepID=UPI0030F4E9E7